MNVQRIRHRTVITGSQQDLKEFATIVSQARSLPVYEGSVDVKQIGKARWNSLKAVCGLPWPDSVWGLVGPPPVYRARGLGRRRRHFDEAAFQDAMSEMPLSHKGSL